MNVLLLFPVRTSAVEGQQVDLPPGGLRGQVHGHVPQVHRRNDDGLKRRQFSL